MGKQRLARTAHSEEAKTRALAVFAETGSTLSASEATGIPRRTISNWIERDPEIDAKLDALRRAVREKTAHLFAEGARLAASATIDRLENGDWVHQGGQLVRRPVPARDASLIAGIFADKHAALTSGMGKQSTADQNLNELAKRLLDAMDRKKRGPTITVEPVEARKP